MSTPKPAQARAERSMSQCSVRTRQRASQSASKLVNSAGVR
ncbi:hypothetical protein ACFP81_12505 [Deinococcus lacus]|uniref:Uncharacterized protein n=1 Tax=Deinococcus lacus TaxID=392561 RepID=A0ABW1YGR0_9DEIO